MERSTKEPMAYSTRLSRWLRWYKNPPAMWEAWVQLGRSPGGERGNPLQYSCLENPMNRAVWWATVHGVTKSLTRLSDQHFQHKCFRVIGGSIRGCSHNPRLLEGTSLVYLGPSPSIHTLSKSIHTSQDNTSLATKCRKQPWSC